MKKRLVTGLLASLLLIDSLPALADPHGHWHYGDAPIVVERHHHRHHGAPLAWMLGGVVLGSALVSIAAPRPVAPAQAIVVAPPPPPRTAWFCASYQAYYPNVPYCPEGWQPVVVY
jgi:hypothetical protein